MTPKPAKWVTTAEFLAQLERDPVFQRAEAGRHADDLRRDQELRADERDLVRELRSAGVRVSRLVSRVISSLT